MVMISRSQIMWMTSEKVLSSILSATNRIFGPLPFIVYPFCILVAFYNVSDSCAELF